MIEIPLTQKALADAVGVSPAYITLAKRAGFKPSHGPFRSTLSHFLRWLEASEFNSKDWVRKEAK